MSRPCRSCQKRRPHPVLDALDEIVRILTAPETPVSNLAKALNLLDAELDLRDGRVALLDPEGRLTSSPAPARASRRKRRRPF